MDQALSRLVTASSLVVLAGVLSGAACTHASDQRVVEPAGGQDASTTSPDLADAGISPIGPIASPFEPQEDFRLVRSPEVGLALEGTRSLKSNWDPQQSGLGGAGGSAGYGGSDLRPVTCVACGGGDH
jgi:hypothetical protein